MSQSITEITQHIVSAQQSLSKACSALTSVHPLTKHLPQFKELSALIQRLPQIAAELQREKL